MLVAFVAGLAIAGIYLRGLEPQDIWSIGIYEGVDPLRVHPASGVMRKPALDAADVSDVSARFVADPFLVLDGLRWWMFLEVLNKASRRGEIAVASSSDGIAWKYDRIVLREPFHLSYPYVFEAGGGFCMIPECGQVGAVRLYRPVVFPYKWRFERQLLSGRYVDASILRFEGRWWLFAQRDGRALTLHFADQIEGPWTEHPLSPIVQDDIGVSRPGGRILHSDGRVLRFSQDGVHTYGRRLRAFQVDELTTTRYREREVLESPVLDASGSGWNADGMHHLDALQVDGDRWIAAVDGKRIVQRFNWRRGLGWVVR
jgi:hypothetical protein